MRAENKRWPDELVEVPPDEWLQSIKAEVGFGDHAAVEVYPPDAHVVDVQAMRHLWILPEPPPYMWLDL